ncbi:MAG TPA: hypothetical protein VF469_38485 [Kofleriaceae bacterium]
MLVAACTSPATPPVRSPAPPPGPIPPKPSAAPAVTAEAFCERFDRLTTRCERLASARLDPATCVADARSAIKEDPGFAAIAKCVIEHDDCDAALECAAGQLDPTADPRACDDESQLSVEHAAGIPRAEWDRRNGAGVTVFRNARSTKEAPVEMCGVRAATEWLTMLRCDDGSQPIKNVDDAEHARSGNVGPGGRCHSIIDRYLVPCPEQRYEIFIDAYICPTGSP